MEKHVRVVLETLSCASTTEMGEDEVYIPSAVTYSVGPKKESFVAPGSESHWNMNDSGGDAWRDVNFTLVNSALPVGDRIDVNSLIMERDGGSPAQAVKVASGIAAIVGAGNPIVVGAAAIATLISTILPDDTDDWIGGVGLSLINNGADVDIEWQAGSRSRLVFRPEVEAQINALPPMLEPLKKILKERLLPRTGSSASDIRAHFLCEGDGSKYSAFLRIDIT